MSAAVVAAAAAVSSFKWINFVPFRIAADAAFYSHFVCAHSPANCQYRMRSVCLASVCMRNHVFTNRSLNLTEFVSACPSPSPLLLLSLLADSALCVRWFWFECDRCKPIKIKCSISLFRLYFSLRTKRLLLLLLASRATLLSILNWTNSTIATIIIRKAPILINRYNNCFLFSRNLISDSNWCECNGKMWLRFQLRN